ncbi:MAG: efflux RND transporter periplasmic adaptor subunit [Polyangiales bacterium]
MAMSEGRVVALALLPLLAGSGWLVALRRAEPADAARAAFKGGGEPVAVATAGPLEVERPYLGVVVAGYTADVGSEVSGNVTEVSARVGMRVKAQDPLLRVDASGSGDDVRAARAKLEQQRSSVARARADLAEASDLVTRMQGISSGVSDRTLLAARAHEDQARATLAEAQAGLGVHEADVGQQLGRSQKQVIRAPFDGIVVARFVDPGGLVTAGQIVARVITEDYFVRFAMPPDEARARVAGFAVQVEVDGAREPLEGVVADIQPEVDAAAQMVFARARLERAKAEAAGVISGARVRVRPVARGPGEAR